MSAALVMPLLMLFVLGSCQKEEHNQFYGTKWEQIVDEDEIVWWDVKFLTDTECTTTRHNYSNGKWTFVKYDASYSVDGDVVQWQFDFSKYVITFIASIGEYEGKTGVLVADLKLSNVTAPQKVYFEKVK